jgi:hypothetical protein
MPYGPRLSEDDLLSRVCERIRDGRLPVALSEQVFAGHGGTGDICQVCDAEILPSQVLYEVPDPRGGNPLMFHLSCHAVWQLECVRRTAAGGRKQQRDYEG